MDANQPSDHSGEAENLPSGRADGAVSDADRPPVLREPATAAVWQMERDLRQAKAAQLAWMLRFHDDYVAQARVPYVADHESAKSRQAPKEVLASLTEIVEYAEQEAGRAALMFIAEAVGRSEYVVTTEYHAVCRATRQLPQVWQAFTEGRICNLRLRRITTAAEKLTTDTAITDLNQQAPGFAETHRIGELDTWLKAFIHTAEPTMASERFALAARGRRVTVTDIEDGMSLLSAIIPTLSARAIQRRLEALTRSPVHPVPHNPLIAEHIFALEQDESFSAMVPHHAAEPDGLLTQELPPLTSTALNSTPLGRPATAGRHQEELDALAQLCAEQGSEQGSDQDPTHSPYQPLSIDHLPTTKESGDPRNLDQRAADAFCAWMLNAETPEGIEIDAQIGIIVHEETLTGAAEHPATTRDGSTCIPAGNIRDLLAHQKRRLQWYQLLHSEDDDLLAIKSSGRYPPPRLRTALWFRDRTCTATGCTIPAERCDADHIEAFEHGGETTAANLQLHCRRHHRLKSWGYPTRTDYLHTTIAADVTHTKASLNGGRHSSHPGHKR